LSSRLGRFYGIAITWESEVAKLIALHCKLSFAVLS
jgi:hypothetical protein